MKGQRIASLIAVVSILILSFALMIALPTFAQDGGNWQTPLPSPMGFLELPHNLDQSVLYVTPASPCDPPNDIQATCSTLEQSVTRGLVVIEAGEMLVATGDLIEFYAVPADSYDLVDGRAVSRAELNYDALMPLFPSPSENPRQLWVIANANDPLAGGAPIVVALRSDFGMFRGFFKVADFGMMTQEAVYHIATLHLERYLYDEQTVNRFFNDQMTAVAPAATAHPNCVAMADVIAAYPPDGIGYVGEGCDGTNVRAVVYSAGIPNLAMYGYYTQARDPSWIPFALQAGTPVVNMNNSNPALTPTPES